MPCIATVPGGPEEAGCGAAEGIFALADMVSEKPESAVFEEIEVDGCVASAGMTLTGAVLEELDAVEAFLVGAGMDWEGPLEGEVGGIGVVVEGPLVAEVVNGRFTATIVVDVGNMLGE